jgi:hypothetical protein
MNSGHTALIRALIPSPRPNLRLFSPIITASATPRAAPPQHTQSLKQLPTHFQIQGYHYPKPPDQHPLHPTWCSHPLPSYTHRPYFALEVVYICLLSEKYFPTNYFGGVLKKFTPRHTNICNVSSQTGYFEIFLHFALRGGSI